MSSSKVSSLASSKSRSPWWRESAIYQVYPRSFKDSNGDGEGDLAGVISQLDYVKALGVDAIWLSPFYTSPNNDGGYDVANPRDVDPRFGSISDAEALIEATHARGLRIIVDIVPNHFSTEHQWFKEAINSLPGSKARNRFHFYDGRGANGEIPPNNWCSIFGGSAWTRIKELDGTAGQWYLHLFDSTQADLNWENNEVRLDFEKTLRFWLDKGVDGFRIDVAHGLVKEEILTDHRDPEGLTRALRLDVSDMSRVDRESLLSDVPFFDREGVHEIYRHWRKIFDSYPGQRMSVAEAWVHPSSRATRYVRSDELHQIFNFDFLIAEWDADFLKTAINKTLREVSAVDAPATWVLCNHDSPRLVTRLGGGEQGRRKARAMALLTHALPGGIYIFQGEELGLEDAAIPDERRQDPVFFRTHGADKGRDGARVPIPWSAGLPHFGFTSGEPWLPMPAAWESLAVSSQDTSDSYLALYRKSIAMRRDLFNTHSNTSKDDTPKDDTPKDDTPKDLEISWIETPHGVLAFRRGDHFILYSNVTDNELDIALSEADSDFAQVLASSPEARVQGNAVHLPAHSTLWLSRTKFTS
jgi:alpha-glucosidase